MAKLISLALRCAGAGQTGSGLLEAFLHVSTRGCCWASLEMLSSGPLLWSEEELLYKSVKDLQDPSPAQTPSTFAPNFAFITDHVSKEGSLNKLQVS